MIWACSSIVWRTLWHAYLAANPDLEVRRLGKSILWNHFNKITGLLWYFSNNKNNITLLVYMVKHFLNSSGFNGLAAHLVRRWNFFNKTDQVNYRITRIKIISDLKHVVQTDSTKSTFTQVSCHVDRRTDVRYCLHYVLTLCKENTNSKEIYWQLFAILCKQFCRCSLLF
jgi:hypothetical protein